MVYTIRIFMGISKTGRYIFTHIAKIVMVSTWFSLDSFKVVIYSHNLFVASFILFDYSFWKTQINSAIILFNPYLSGSTFNNQYYLGNIAFKSYFLI
ncbi:MAG: hypothetical protein HQ522_17540 [Bacteroidetes bacterium]|nr:hypothetical protein [Bacteroidota bacterium]